MDPTMLFGTIGVSFAFSVCVFLWILAQGFSK